jgi:hypothetical protein
MRQTNITFGFDLRQSLIRRQDSLNGLQGRTIPNRGKSYTFLFSDSPHIAIDFNLWRRLVGVVGRRFQ